jgi:hypothetical protein
LENSSRTGPDILISASANFRSLVEEEEEVEEKEATKRRR